MSWNRKISLTGRESQILQGFVNQEKEFGFYSKEALLRVMRSPLSQKAAAEVVLLLKESDGRVRKGTEVEKRMLSRTAAKITHMDTQKVIVALASRVKET